MAFIAHWPLKDEPDSEPEERESTEAIVPNLLREELGLGQERQPTE